MIQDNPELRAGVSRYTERNEQRRVFGNLADWGLRCLAGIHMLQNAERVMNGELSMEHLLEQYSPIPPSELNEHEMFSLEPVRSAGVIAPPPHTRLVLGDRFALFHENAGGAGARLSRALSALQQSDEEIGVDNLRDVYSKVLANKGYGLKDVIEGDLMQPAYRGLKACVLRAVWGARKEHEAAVLHGRLDRKTPEEWELALQLADHYEHALKEFTPNMFKEEV